MLVVATHNPELINDDNIKYQVLDLMKNFFRESPYDSGFYYSDKKAEALYKRLMTTNDSLVLLWIENDTVYGALGATVFEPLFSEEKVASELVWYVSPEKRKSRIGFELLNAYEYWAKELVKVNHVMLAHLDLDPRLEKYFERRGYMKHESTFVKEL